MKEFLDVRFAMYHCTSHCNDTLKPTHDIYNPKSHLVLDFPQEPQPIEFLGFHLTNQQLITLTHKKILGLNTKISYL